MFNQRFIRNAIDRSAENSTDRRKFLKAAGAAGIVGAGAATGAGSALAGGGGGASGPSDVAILNFALNLEYLEAEFYLRAVGRTLPDEFIGSNPGPVSGGREIEGDVSSLTRQYAQEIAEDELAHVRFLRTALGDAAVDRPALNLDSAFAAAGSAATGGDVENFDPYANELFFLLGAFIFEDVGVTAYKGASPLVDNKTYLEAAAGILAVEAYHSGNIRTALVAMGQENSNIFDLANGISDARDSLDNGDDVDQGIGSSSQSNIVPADNNAIAFSRTPGDVLNIVYLTPDKATSGGFFPDGVNGPLNQSSG